MRLIARFEKGEAACALSHLDVQRAFQRALRRSGLPLSYSEGFNPHPLLSFASALAVGVTSEAEWLDVRLSEPVSPETFVKTLDAALPPGFRMLEAFEAEENFPALTPHTALARYRISIGTAGMEEAPDALQERLAHLTQGPLWVEKRGKGGVKKVDLQPLIREARCEAQDGALVWEVLGVHTPAQCLNPKLLSKAALLGECAIHRTALLTKEGQPLNER